MSVSSAVPILELTSEAVLVTQWVEGERLDITAARDPAEAQRLQVVAMTSYLFMLLELGALHAAPGLRGKGNFFGLF